MTYPEYSASVMDIDNDLIAVGFKTTHGQRVVSTQIGHFTAAQAREYAAKILEAADVLEGKVVAEPKNFGAIVSAHGHRWIRADLADDGCEWRREDGDAWEGWDALKHDALLLSEGIA